MHCGESPMQLRCRHANSCRLGRTSRRKPCGLTYRTTCPLQHGLRSYASLLVTPRGGPELPRPDAVADELLGAAEITEPPVDVDWLAKEQGALVVPEDLDSEVSGVLYREPGNLIIAVNRHHAPNRRRFTIAHELGHLLLHQGRPVIVDHVVRARINLRDHRSSLATEREEIEANRFAAHLLMPPGFVHYELDAALRRGLDEQATIDRLARRFGVSTQAMEFRLTNLGLRAAV